MVPQGPTPLTQGILSGGEGSQSVDEVLVRMGDPLLIQDLYAAVLSTGKGTGTNGAAICGGLGELLMLLKAASAVQGLSC